MKALIQRVSKASVEVDGRGIGAIDRGLLVLLGIEKDDGAGQLERMAQKLLAYRVFPDQQGKMNCSLTDIGGSLLLVSQFTLAADTGKGLRPSFTPAAEPAVAENLYRQMIERLNASGVTLASGQFGADMRVSLVNDGPVTFLLQVA